MNIPTAEELYRDTKINSNLDLFSDDVPHLVKLMIEFAKLHVEAALEEAVEKGLIESNLKDKRINNNEIIRNYPPKEEYFVNSITINKDSILNAYPLTNIK